MWYVRNVLYAVLYVRVSCLVVRGCGVLRRYIDVCYCDMFSVVNVYLDHLKFCVVCINSRRYVCCSECNVVSNECNEPTSCFVQPIGAHSSVYSPFSYRVGLPPHNAPFPGVLINSIGPACFYDRMPFLTSTTCVECSVK